MSQQLQTLPLVTPGRAQLGPGPARVQQAATVFPILVWQTTSTERHGLLHSILVEGTLHDSFPVYLSGSWKP
eukprot:CAMPEP_0202108626 /NCGR_PEP_ID=MMETSP0965-20130614/21418_1 /ASSEMBLY_ACC=CAM_ASM_000507 /TAXON_ID=4773 /ORGANISM="Schizochytrium aggregatum, Strain ATCC28209" /LENGTH=71 /DNA_ID=CAMNT_0048677891 /DNA_START=63 /DNA_END=275 /DNA_ORIENTATION=-